MKSLEEKFEKVKIHSYHHLRRYLKFVLHRQAHNKKKFYTEGHHILPVSLFPEFENDKRNKVNLTTREHFVAHLMLAYALNDGGSWLTIRMFCLAKPGHYNRNSLKITSRVFERARIEAAKYNSSCTTLHRSQETELQKQIRVNKWKESYNSKTAKEKAKSREKQKLSRITNFTPQKREVVVCCITCHANLKHNYKKHFLACQRNQEKIQETRFSHIGSCINCHKEFFTYGRLINHIYKCKPKPKRIKVERVDTRKSIFECIKCKKQFRGDTFHYHNHIRRNDCDLSHDEKVKLSRIRARQTILSKSEKEKKLTSENLSKSRKKYLKSLTSEERCNYNERLSLAAQKYYNSECYNPNLKSIQVKLGLKNAKDNRNK